MPPKGQQNKGKAKAKPKAKPKEVSKAAQSGPVHRFTRQQQQISDPEDIEDDPPQAVAGPSQPCPCLRKPGQPVNTVPAAEEPSCIQSERGDGRDFEPRGVNRSQVPALDEDSTLPEAVPLARTSKVSPLLVQALDRPLVPALDHPPVPALASLPEKSVRVLLLFVSVARKNTTKYPVEEVKSIGVFDPDEIAYESTASHEYHWAESDRELWDGFNPPGDEEDEGDDAHSFNHGRSQSRASHWDDFAEQGRT
ncbi:hypothetical protein PM082_022029 [Marasmius tenuissimus]|nr:hypothetical protein PM082_022029 [Marasmius tenuissimus]